MQVDQELDVGTPTSSKTVDQIGRGLNWFEQHWLFAFNAFWGVFITLPWLAPVFQQLGWTRPANILYFIYNFFCHQLPERSWFLFGPQASYTQAEIGVVWDISNELVRRHFIGTPEMGWKVAWSDRMVSMYTTIFLLGLLYAYLRQRGFYLKGIRWWWFIIFITPMGIDGTTHLINDALRLGFRDQNLWAIALTGGIFPAEFYAGDLLWSLNSVLRLITGIFFGIGVVWFLWPMMENEFTYKPAVGYYPRISDRPVVRETSEDSP
ncbi:MAG: DUF2085 domain-containing protein [Chloroflexota bacterium]